MRIVIMLALIFWMFLMVSPVNGKEIGFVEDFSLSEDRANALRQLIPGSSEYYYYSSLHAQNIGDYKQVHEILGQWIKQDGYTSQVREIMNRQALLEYEQNPEKSLDYIKKELNLRFDHRKEVAARKTDYPTKLDPNLISIPTLIQYSFSRYKNLQNIEDSGLDILSHSQLDPNRRRNLLERLRMPDIPGLAKLVADDLAYKHSGGFGSHGIHALLLKSHLDECLSLMPELIDNSNFIQTYLTKLAPDNDTDLRYDPEAKKAYLDRMWNFVKTLAPAHNSLKVHILYQILDFERARGNYDHDLFMTYIRLPRNAPYMNPDYIRQRKFRGIHANLNADFSNATGFAPVVSDEELVRDYLSHFFVKAENYKAYEKLIRDTYLRDVFVETKIVNGLGDMEQWYSLMTPARYQALKDRIDLDFAADNKTFFDADEPVSLDLYVKNIRTLIVKVFELNTFNYYQTHLSEVDTAVNLDGLVATHESVITYDEPSLRRIRRTYEFPQISQSGVFVAEFIGNGKSSRAVIRKGKLYAVDTIGPAGHEFMVFDEKNQPRPHAAIWLSGKEYQPNDNGVIIIPFTNQPGPRKIILRDDHRDHHKDQNICSLASFRHLAENYNLKTGFHTDRESLLRRFTSQVVVRPVLTLNGYPVSLSLLEDVRLSIESIDHEGVASAREIADFKIFEDRESVFEFQVPENLAQIRFILKARIQNMSQNKKQDLSDEMTFSLNEIDTTPLVQDIFLSHIHEDYMLEVLGKNGETKPDRPVNVELKHRYFKNTVHASLQTDDNGRIGLGELGHIEWVKATTTEGTSHTWHLITDHYPYPANLHEQTGKVIHVPYMGKTKSGIWGLLPFKKRVSADDIHVTLLEKRGQTYVADYSNAVGWYEGFLEISQVPAGDYDLFLKDSNTRIRLKITDGDVFQSDEGMTRVLLARHRVLETINEAPLQISMIDVTKKNITIKLANSSEFTRVHVAGTRFMPSFDAFSCLAYRELPEPYEIRLVQPQSQYVAGRNIGDEYRYILDRKYAEKFPGNMLNRPELLLNPWSIRDTETSIDEAAAGEAFDRISADMADRKKAADFARWGSQSLQSFSNLDFLSAPSVMLLNLKPDKSGVITIDREQFKDRQHLHLIAVDPINTVYQEISLHPRSQAGAWEREQKRDLRLLHGLNPEKHFTEQKQIDIVQAGKTFHLEDITTSEFEVYDSLYKIYQLLVTLSGNATLQEFRFILQWHDMTLTEKQEKYSKYACHELNFFIFQKDPEFFDQAVLPYLRNKKDKTFLDHWLMGDNLTAYLEPWAFSQLNIVEKILLATQGGDRDSICRYVKELYDMIPPDVDEYNRLFDTALKGMVLEAYTFGFGAAKDAALDDMLRAEPMLESAPPPAPAAMAFSDEDMAMAMEMEAPEEMTSRASHAKMRKQAAMPEPKAEGISRRKRGFFAPPRDKKRKAARQFFRKLDKTKEWAENNYYHLPIEAQNADLITVNAFWHDYARYISAQTPTANSQQPFFSKHFIYATRNFTEMMLAMSVLDIPFKPGKHVTETKGITFSLKAETPMIVFHKQIRQADPVQEKIPIMVSQNFFNPNDRYRYVDNERFDKYVADEFLVHTAYGCQFVLSNPTSSRQKLGILLQIPHGAMPLNKGFYTRSLPVTLEPYTTQTFEYLFYFPETGAFENYPVQVAKNEQFVAGAEPVKLNVVAQLTRTDTDSWDYISQNGEAKEVLEYLRTHNLNRLDLNKIAFRMKDREFFGSAIRLLGNRHVYHHTLWQYGIYHNVKPVISEYLKHSEFAHQCGYFIETPLLTIDPVERKTYQHLEYKPLVNARAHQLGKERKILNNRFYDQYHAFMKVLSYRKSLTNSDLMAITYYLLLQDRIAEAMDFFDRIHLSDDLFSRQAVSQSRLQYDYLRVYLDFYKENLTEAESIVAKYLDYPVPRWQHMFHLAARHLDELMGRTSEAEQAVVDKEDRDQVHDQMAATETSFDFSIESRKITLNYQNLASCRINYYPMDIELLFSRNPFVQQQAEHFAFITPNQTDEITLPENQTRFVADLPEKFRNSNLMVEIIGNGIRKSRAYYANSLDIQVIENYGQISVVHQDTRKFLSKVYVKVYARMKGGDVQFYKDGYTDLRGRFDYVSLNTNELDYVEKFAILVLSDKFGAVIREAAPPKR